VGQVKTSNAIIFCIRTPGRCNQYDRGEGILSQDRCEWTSIEEPLQGRTEFSVSTVILNHDGNPWIIWRHMM
jgi:hypothetical protein